MIDRNAAIFVTGHRGMVGSALVRRLTAAGFTNIVTAARAELDLREQSAVDAWFDAHRPEYVIHAAGTVGGIQANATRPAEFLYDNLMIHATVLQAAYRTGVEKLLYLGSSCIYPRDCPAADQRRVSADRAVGENQRSLRRREDRRPEVVRSLSQTVRLPLHFGDADEPIRPKRQF